MIKGIKLRLYPNKTQKNQLWQMFGNDRFVWNQMLAMMDERYQNNKNLPFLSKFKLDYLLKPLKQEYPFLKKAILPACKWLMPPYIKPGKTFLMIRLAKLASQDFILVSI